MNIIDFRVRPPVAGFQHASMYTQAARSARMGAAFGFADVSAHCLFSRSLRDFEQELVEAGVGLSVLPGRVGAPGVGPADNAQLIDYAKSRNDMCVFPAVDPSTAGWRDDITQMRRVAGQVVRGLVLEPGLLEHPIYADDERCFPVYEYCVDQALPLILSAGGNIGPDSSHSLPIYVDRVARDFPALNIIVAHGGWPWITAINHVAFRRGNVFISPDMYALMPGNEGFAAAMNSYLSERYLYASSYPFVPITPYRDAFLRTITSDTVAERVMFANASALLGAVSP